MYVLLECTFTTCPKIQRKTGELGHDYSNKKKSFFNLKNTMKSFEN